MGKDRWVEGYREGKVGAKYDPPYQQFLGNPLLFDEQIKKNAEYEKGYEKVSKDK